MNPTPDPPPLVPERLRELNEDKGCVLGFRLGTAGAHPGDEVAPRGLCRERVLEPFPEVARRVEHALRARAVIEELLELRDLLRAVVAYGCTDVRLRLRSEHGESNVHVNGQ